jgi:hypothetical protein
VSGLAVAALGVSALAALVVLTVGVAAKIKGRPVLLPSVLFLAGLGLVLSIAARWHIQRAEGTRAGRKLASIALWLSLLSGFGYGAYYYGTEFALRKQAEAAADQWFALLGKGQPELAFRLTRDPAQQRGLPENDPEEIRRRFGTTELAAFLRADLPRMWRSWPDKTAVRLVGVKDWEITPQGYQVELNYEVRDPEGLYDVVVTTLGRDDPAAGGRDWQIVFSRSGLRERKFTKLGRLCLEIQSELQRRFLPAWNKQLADGPGLESQVLIEGVAPPADKRETVVKEIKAPGAVNLFPATSPLRPPGLPTSYITAADVRFVQNVEITLPSLGGPITSSLNMRPKDEALVKEMLRLAGPGWEKEPAESPRERPAELTPYRLEFQVSEIDIKPSAPRLEPVSPNAGPP